MASPRRRHLAVTLACAGALITSCGTAHEGNGLPNKGAASQYVTARFESTIEGLEDAITKVDNVETHTERYLRLNDSWTDGPLESAIADGTKRITKSRDDKDPMYDMTIYEPDPESKYILLGPGYSDIASTPWVQLPGTPAEERIHCQWGGIQTICKIASAIHGSVIEEDGQLRSATRTEDGGVTITTDITYSTFMYERIIVLPPDAEATILEQFSQDTIDTSMIFDSDMNLTGITLDGEESDGEDEVEVKIEYSIVGEATDRNFPEVPSSRQTTRLTQGEFNKKKTAIEEEAGDDD